MSEFTGISLDPEDTPQGAMERVFLAEAHSPAFDDYDAASDLVEMRNMREVFENRLKNPAEYEAPGAENEIDIVKMGHQFQGFANYPKIEAGIESNIKEIVKNANDPHHPQQAAYAQHVLNAIKAASENIDKPVAEYPDATLWLTKGSKAPGPDFRILGTVGNNTFYGTIPQKSNAVKPGSEPDHLEGKTYLEKLRHYAAQARADAAKKPLTPAMQLHRNLMNLIQRQRSYAPVPNGGGGPARPAAGDKGAWAAPQPAAGHPAAVPSRMDATLQKLSPAPVEASNAHSTGAAPAAGASGGATGPRFAARAPGGEVDTGATAATNPAAAAEHRKALKLALQEYFDQQSRLPPNGAAGFDPRLTPAWPALQLPA